MTAEPKPERDKREGKKTENGRTVFDTELIRAAVHQQKRRCTFFMSNGETFVGFPITVDKYFVLMCEEDDLENEHWLAKNHIVNCKIELTEEDRSRRTWKHEE